MKRVALFRIPALDGKATGFLGDDGTRLMFEPGLDIRGTVIIEVVRYVAEPLDSVAADDFARSG